MKLLYPFSSKDKNDGALYRLYLVLYPFALIFLTISLFIFFSNDSCESRASRMLQLDNEMSNNGYYRSKQDTQDYNNWIQRKDGNKERYDESIMRCSDGKTTESILILLATIVGSAFFHIVFNFLLFKIIIGFVITGKPIKEN